MFSWLGIWWEAQWFFNVLQLPFDSKILYVNVCSWRLNQQRSTKVYGRQVADSHVGSDNRRSYFRQDFLGLLVKLFKDYQLLDSVASISYPALILEILCSEF